MEGPINGGMLYHEVQESKLCAVHCVNTVLQGPFFSEFDLAALASDLDRREHQMMLEGSAAAAGDAFLTEESFNVSMDGDFSIQVLQKALEVWDLQVIPLHSPVAEPAQVDPELENAFICHLQDHWFCIRKVNGEWYNFDSLYAAPEHLSKFYLSAYLDTLKGFGWSIFLVRGNFPKECPMTSGETTNGFGQWLLPEDAERIIKSCNSGQRQQHHQQQQLQPPRTPPMEEDDDLNAAIAASLRDTAGEAGTSGNDHDDDLEAAIAASLKDSSPAVVNKENDAVTAPAAVATLTDTTPPATPVTGGEDVALENESKKSGLQDK
ncbi:putative ubiquitinyl hydrolase 1 [Helianthus debilis subsp. tardiflorus]